MLQGHVGEDHGGVVRQHVGRVPAAAEPRLHRHRVHARRRERPEADRGERLELGDGVPLLERQRLGGVAHVGGRRGEGGLADRGAVQLDALGPVDDVRRQVRPRPRAVPARRGGRSEPGGRGLAVRPHHVDAPGRRPAGRRARRAAPDALQAEAHPQDLQPADPVAGPRAAVTRARDARGERLPLGGVAGRLLALGLDQVRWGALHEARVGQLALPPASRSPSALASSSSQPRRSDLRVNRLGQGARR